MTLDTWWRFLDKEALSILDVGCGVGEPLRFINRARRLYAVGSDFFRSYLVRAKREYVHHHLVLCGFRNIRVGEQTFDVVLYVRKYWNI
jgi:ubiquinone/menaquinone biosynthesis C-methylase UbiE